MVLIRHCPDPVKYETTNKIMEQLKNCICKISLEEIGIGTGFFCFIYFKTKKIPVMITNNHIIYEKMMLNKEKIPIEINNETKNIYLAGRKLYTSREYDITIIEINPEKDCFYNFLEIDENIFLWKNLLNEYIDLSIYILQNDENNSYASYGKIKNLDVKERDLPYLCSTTKGSGGAPIMNQNNLKIIGIHKGCNKYNTYNVGTLLKNPINEFINKYKDYIETIIESPNTSTFGINENKIKDESKINNYNKINIELENALNKEKEKNKELEEQIIKLKALLNNNNNNINNYGDLNKNKQDALIESVLKKDKEIEELKSKLNRFPFQLLKDEKLMSIIITSIDQKIHCSIICKNTDIFYSIETKLYQMYHEYSENENFFTVNGKKINRHKSLDYNNIKDNDIIILNVID